MGLHRRSFLRSTAAAAGTPLLVGAAPKGGPITLVLDGNDSVAAARPVLKAMHLLQQELTKAGYAVQRAQSPQQAPGTAVIAAGSTSPLAAGALASARVAQPVAPESLALFEAKVAGHLAIVACAADVRGLVYAVYELVDRVKTGTPLKFPTPVAVQPANPVRSVMRQFTSELYDKPWFYDRAMWPQYLSMLAANRFNRFDLTFGLGYDMLKNVADPYLVFTYPFLMAVPGYDVKVTNLPDAERDRNLATLRYISEQTLAAGLDFQLGLWMHGYEWKDTPDAKYVVTGLKKDNHAAYCRDALTALLKALPAVSSVGLRIHGESGVAEGSYDFWNAVFDGVARCGRKVEIDLHAKGIDDTMMANALATGMPVNISPKMAAEHIGLPYHQADIRPSEIPAAGTAGKGLMTLSEGQRSFTRYGYADLMRDDRKYTVRPRVFYGTQRILASGSAELAAAHGRAFQFCGMTGGEVMEPLTYRGRRGSAVPGTRRSGYVPDKIEPTYDWQKYDYWYRTWGRMLFAPDSDQAECRRVFNSRKGGPDLERALSAASCILPLVTQAHSASAACDFYWPEIVWNMPLASEAPELFWDTPSPRTFQNVTALDPQLFSSCIEYANEVLSERTGKYSPLEVAEWLTRYTEAAKSSANLVHPSDIDTHRLHTDIWLQIGIGRYFAEKLIAGVMFALHEKTGDRSALEFAAWRLDAARNAWAQCVDMARGVYAPDLSISDRFTERGQWADRLKGIDDDLAAVKLKLATAPAQSNPRVATLLASGISNQVRPPLPCQHTPPTAFTPNQPVDLLVAVREGLSKATLWYRHVNQGERWVGVEMNSTYDGWRASIPAAYTASPYPLQYYFEFRSAPDRAWLYPGLVEDLMNQPYFVLRRA